MFKKNTIEQQIENNISEIKHLVRVRQYPKKHAPTIPPTLLMEIYGGLFTVHKQNKNTLVLSLDVEMCVKKNVKPIRILSYICGAMDHVSIENWNWRPIRFRANKIFLKPVSPIFI